ncbi:alpha/beta hydrolase [Priestia aryabhattai]|uniref:alpha/beta hydrolase n=1 Tax=Priestia aryabhattai TaxID=412384 RepID=UPI001ADC41CB|nr:alpha/beta hydrolase [Priestia aryabhattai]QTL51154.1 alpha/beta hydrolase [Priestia aryabhattai]
MASTGNYIFELSENVIRKSVSYTNRFGINIAADLYLPKDFDDSKKHAAVIIGSPYGGVKEQGAGIYAQNMAERGFVALTFDPSYNGYSGGEPRHLSSPELFVEDFSAAVDYVGTRPFVDRNQIGAIGMCGSGGFAISAAQVDRRIKAVATVSMYDISRAQSQGFNDTLTEKERNEMLDAIAEQRYAEFEGGQPVLTPRGAPIGFDDNTDPIGREFGEFYSTPRGYHPNSITQFTMTSSMSFMNFPLMTYIKSISPRPILFIIGEQAHSRYFSEDAYEMAAEPKELYVVPNAGHVDLYDKTNLIPFDKLETFFTENLK